MFLMNAFKHKWLYVLIINEYMFFTCHVQRGYNKVVTLMT